MPPIFCFYLLATAHYELNTGDWIVNNYRLDGNLVNTRKKTSTSYIFGLQYAEDTAYPTPVDLFRQWNTDISIHSYTVGFYVKRKF